MDHHTKGVSYNPWVGIVFGVLTFVMIGRQYDAKKPYPQEQEIGLQRKRMR
ncbi:hypothetical protein [Chryseobacterium indoltheticum]|uniref:hypothetical protein n=1 Tax=Chryseobacterium indoltheticum TaxID=254 RepID=UPI0016272705|nr:hypothetical protein [Chryseobacterium indoltheticum]